MGCGCGQPRQQNPTSAELVAQAAQVAERERALLEKQREQLQRSQANALANAGG